MKSTVFSLLPGRVLAELESLERSLRMTPRQLDFPQLQQQVEDGDGFEDDVMVYMLYIYVCVCIMYYLITILTIIFFIIGIIIVIIVFIII